MVRIRFEISANTSVEAYIKVFGVKIPLYPKRSKKISPRKFKHGYPKQKEKQGKKAVSPQKKKKPAEKIPLGDTITTVLELIKLLFSRFFKHLRLDISKIIVIVGGEDAAKCAIQYGVISQAVAYLLEFLDTHLRISKKRDGRIDVLCDFTAETITYDVHISASLTVWQILDIGISLAYNYFKGKDIFHLLNS